ncbi:hypothetical protein Tco_1135849, partial [Tanacetum coccineum]
VLLAPIHPCLPVTYIMYIIKTIDNTAGENAVAVPTGTSDKGTETTEGASRMVKESKKKARRKFKWKVVLKLRALISATSATTSSALFMHRSNARVGFDVEFIESRLLELVY